MRTMIVKVNVRYMGDSMSQCRKVNVKEIFVIQLVVVHWVQG